MPSLLKSALDCARQRLTAIVGLCRVQAQRDGGAAHGQRRDDGMQPLAAGLQDRHSIGDW